MNKLQTLDQRRAAHAWATIEKLRDSKQKLGPEAKRLPMRILSSGLGPALQFLKVRARRTKQEEKPEMRVLDAVSAWLAEARPPLGERDLILRIVTGDASFLQYATDESLAYLEWLIRFAEAEGILKED